MMTEERFHEAGSRGHTGMDDDEARDKSQEMQQRIEWLLELQERQLEQQLDFAKRAFKHQQLKNIAVKPDDQSSGMARKGEMTSNDIPDVDDEWQRFAATHAEELDALDEEKPKPTLSLFNNHFSLHKVAASFIGVLLVSGIAFAAIWKHTHPNRGEDTPYSEKVDVQRHDSSPSLGEAGGESEPVVPVVFDNVPLDTMLADIAAYYGAAIEYKNDTVRLLRFHFVWKREDGLSRAVEKLNRFESLAIRLEDNKIIVE